MNIAFNIFLQNKKIFTRTWNIQRILLEKMKFYAKNCKSLWDFPPGPHYECDPYMLIKCFQGIYLTIFFYRIKIFWIEFEKFEYDFWEKISIFDEFFNLKWISFAKNPRVTYKFFPDPPIKVEPLNFDTTWARDVSSIIFLQN